MKASTATLPKPQDNAPMALMELLKHLRVKVTALTLHKTLQQHPNYPSLLSLSDALKEWNVPNRAFKLNDIEQLRSLPTPYLIHTRLHNGWFVLVKHIQDDLITWYDTSGGWNTESLASFGQKWTGFVLLAESSQDAGEANFAYNRRVERLQSLRSSFVLAGALALLLAGLAYMITTGPLLFAGFAITKLLGLGVSVLLLMQLFDPANSITNRICQLNSKTDCSQILDSSAAKLWGWLSWAEVGFVYFAGCLLSLFLTGSHPFLVASLAFLSMLAFPYTFYSLYYQGLVARKWCVLCLLVQAVLATEFALSLVLWPLSFPDINWQVALLTLWGFGLPTLLYVYFKPFLQKAARTEELEEKLSQVTNNPNVFRALLHQERSISALPESMPYIQLGNPLAQHTLTIVSNPHCSPCAHHHKEIQALIAHNKHLKANIVFLVKDGPEGRSHTVARHLLALTGEASDKLGAAMDAWYGLAQKELKDYENWAKAFPVDTPLAPYDYVLEQHYDWCIKNKILATPRMYLNGYQLPKSYQLKDIKRFL